LLEPERTASEEDPQIRSKFLNANTLALLFVALSFGLSLWVNTHIFENMAHVEDEIAYMWQAQVIARGALSRPTPEFPEHFLVPFVVDHAGQRFGKYPLGWPALLSAGVRFGIRNLVNPLLGALAVWLTYLLGKRVRDARVGLLAAGLLVVSPFFLLNTGSLMAHPLGLVLAAAFVLFWTDSFCYDEIRWWKSAVIGLALGALALTRPLSALAVAVFYFYHGVLLLRWSDRRLRLHVLSIGVLAVGVGLLHFVWQFAVTGDPLTNPYTLWWPYDHIGFGPGAGRYGHDLPLALSTTYTSLFAFANDLNGWPRISWLFIPLGLWALREDRTALQAVSPLFTLIALYSAYWIGASLFGPRYYFEALYAAMILTAAGIVFVWDHALTRIDVSFQRLALGILLIALTGLNLFAYLPGRLGEMRGLFGVNRAMLVPFEAGRVAHLAPAMILVHPEHWAQYGGLLELQDAWLEDEILFVTTRNVVNDAAFFDHYTQLGWAIYHYYPDEPGKLYTGARR
jgi:4-amino-4-deoxy-L-arabinose transferase-like glycosyltransferase